MNVVTISTNDLAGGAARAAYRLHTAARRNGLNTRMIVQFKDSDDPTVEGPRTNLQKSYALLRTALDHLPQVLFARRSPSPFHIQWLPDRLPVRIHRLNPDLVHLHWICRGFVSLASLKALRPPMIWTLHDLWPFTGGCHYPGDCRGYMCTCGKCPQLGSWLGCDPSHWALRQKLELWRKQRPVIVCPSRWLKSRVEQSIMPQAVSVKVIPNGIDLERFRPLDKSFCRLALHLPPDGRLVLFGADLGARDGRKGLDLLQKALERIERSDPTGNTQLVVFGSAAPFHNERCGLQTHCVGRIKDEITLPLLYSACDVYVAPSLEDNLPNTIMEAMACATPVVGFKVGGIPEMIDHQKNGYLARALDEADLAAGIRWVLQDLNRWQSLARAARSAACERFDIQNVVRRYARLYEAMVTQTRC